MLVTGSSKVEIPARGLRQKQKRTGGGARLPALRVAFALEARRATFEIGTHLALVGILTLPVAGRT
jgi:hypothetical protein